MLQNSSFRAYFLCLIVGVVAIVVNGCGGGGSGSGSGDATAPAAATNFRAVYTPSGVLLNWVNPTVADFYAVMIRRSTTAYPTDPGSGDWVYTGSDVTTLDSIASSAVTTYYYSLFCFDTSRNISTAANATTAGGSAGGINNLVATVVPGGIQLSWGLTGPAAGLTLYIRRSTASYPISLTDGDAVYTNPPDVPGSPFMDPNGVVSNATHYYSAFVDDGTTVWGPIAASVYVSAAGLVSHSDASGADQVSDAQCVMPEISSDGKYIIFQSNATNLGLLRIAGVDLPDTNNVGDIFRYNIETEEVDIISQVECLNELLGPDATNPPAAVTENAVVNGDGTVFAFETTATNLTTRDAQPRRRQVFRVDINEIGDERVYLVSRSNGWTDVTVNNPTALPMGGDSFNPSISDDGKFVAFDSECENLVESATLASVDTNGVRDVFVYNYDAAKGLDENAATCVDCVSWDYNSIINNKKATPNLGQSIKPCISGNGKYIVFESTCVDIDGYCPTVSGNWQIFRMENSYANTKTFNHLVSRPCSQLEEGDGDSINANTDYTGNYVVFQSTSRNLLNSETNATGALSQIYYVNMVTCERILVSIAWDAASYFQGCNGNCTNPFISGNGRYVAFLSAASDLIDPTVDSDTNGIVDIYVRDMQARQTIRISKNFDGTQVVGAFTFAEPKLDYDGEYITFQTNYTFGSALDTNGVVDIYKRKIR